MKISHIWCEIYVFNDIKNFSSFLRKIRGCLFIFIRIFLNISIKNLLANRQKCLMPKNRQIIELSVLKNKTVSSLKVGGCLLIIFVSATNYKEILEAYICSKIKASSHEECLSVQ